MIKFLSILQVKSQILNTYNLVNWHKKRKADRSRSAFRFAFYLQFNDF